MTPQLQQAIKLLQYSNLELAEFVESELERNPLLSREDTEHGPASTEAAPAEPKGEQVDQGESGDSMGDYAELSITENGSSPEAEASLDADYESLNPEAAPADASADSQAMGTSEWSPSTRSGNGDDSDFSALDRATAEKSLKDHLAEQLAIAPLTPAQRLIASTLIEMVEDDGYLRANTQDLADRLGTDPSAIDDVISVLQGFDPAGVMARDLKECLALQLKERDRFDPAMATFVDNLELLATHELKTLKSLCAVDDEDLTDMIAELRALTPKPGLSFGGEPTAAVSPDVSVRQTTSGTWAVELNAETLPRVLLDSRYYAEVNAAARSAEEKSFISECHQTANWLVRSLDQRARTILKVASEIVRQQDGFLAEGIAKLRPLNLKTVADAIDMHESTVSRVTSNKYIATPRGVFELKYFFTAAIASRDGGEAHSAEAVRHMIKALIDKETAKTVLSDDRIVELLAEDGVDIARRTVAKYREAMRIPSSVQRRRLLRQAS